MRFNISFIFLLCTLISYIGAFQRSTFLNGLTDLLNQGVTEDQIRKWWFRTQARQRDFPRTFSFCFAHDIVFPPKVAPYQTHFKKMDEVYDYDPEEYGWPSRMEMNKFKSMQFKRISIQRRNPNQTIYNGEEGAKPFKLQQWVDFLVTFTEPIEGLYVQANGGPLAVPTGEFTTDFECTDGERDDWEYELNQNIVPCHFTPRSAIRHPNVFIFDARGRDKKDKVQFRFRWTESQCQETGFFQFIMIATTDHSSDFDSILSPIFRYRDLDTPSAVPSPYHHYYDKITCGLNWNDAYTKNIVMIDNGTRIIPNRAYDQCVRNHLHRGNSGGFDRKDTCPPGPFSCKSQIRKPWKNAAEWKELTNQWWHSLVTKPFYGCCEVRFPLPYGPPTTTTTTAPTGPTTPTSSGSTAPSTTGLPSTTQSTAQTSDMPTTTTEPTLQQKQEKFLKDVTVRSEKKLGITHGDFCVLVWLVLMPIANLISRFFKDFPDMNGLGLGIWIISHVALQTIGVMIVWWSFGLVVGGGEDKLGNISGRHFILGTVATAIQHLQFITGLKRNNKERKIFQYVLMHASGGYFAQIIAYLAIILSNAAPERKWMVFGFTLIGVICAIAFHLVELKQDKILGVVLHRAQCPVLQRIVLDDGAKPPLAYAKIGILIFLVASKTALFVFMKIVYSEEIVVARHYRKLRDVDDLVNQTAAANARTLVLNNHAYFVDLE